MFNIPKFCVKGSFFKIFIVSIFFSNFHRIKCKHHLHKKSHFLDSVCEQQQQQPKKNIRFRFWIGTKKENFIFFLKSFLVKQRKKNFNDNNDNVSTILTVSNVIDIINYQYFESVLFVEKFFCLFVLFLHHHKTENETNRPIIKFIILNDEFFIAKFSNKICLKSF